MRLSIPVFSISLFVIILMHAFPAKAQLFGNDEKVNKRAKKLYKESRNYISWKNYDKAVQALKKAIDISPSFVKAHNRLGKVYLTKKEFDKAASSFKNVLELANDFSVMTEYHIGRAFFYEMSYDSAQHYLERFMAKDDIPAKQKQKAEQQLSNIAFARKAVDNPVPFDPKNLGPKINSRQPDFSPALTADKKTLIFTRLIDYQGRKQEDFYIAAKKNGEWDKARNLGAPVNTPKNQGAHTITPDGRYIIFTGCHYRDTRGRCDLYITTKKKGRFTKPQNLGNPVNTGAWESQPSIAPDASTLYFASNRKDGYGGSDIWRTNYLGDGDWSEPENLGPKINTPQDERAPFMHSDNQTLYFSSSGHPGMGDQDIYVTRRINDSTWSEPHNLGYPINTPTKDNWLFVSSDGKEAFFASNREDSYGKMDIYSFTLHEEVRPTKVTYVKGSVYDNKTNEKLEAQIVIKNLHTGETVNSVQTDSKTGEFLLTLPQGNDYAYIASKKGYLYHSKHFSLSDTVENKPFMLDIGLQPIEVGSDMVMRNIFFEHDSHQLRDESKVELNRLVGFLRNNPEIEVEIGGHTDNTGTKTYNKELSRKRAKTVYNYLIDNGISKERLTFKGYGETKPIATNDTEEGRARNRRTELTITGKSDE